MDDIRKGAIAAGFINYPEENNHDVKLYDYGVQKILVTSSYNVHELNENQILDFVNYNYNIKFTGVYDYCTDENAVLLITAADKLFKINFNNGNIYNANW